MKIFKALIKIFFLSITFLFSNPDLKAQSGKYYVVDRAPWSQSGNETALNAVIGANNWTKVNYSASATTIFSTSNIFVMLEGSDDNINFINFMATNQSLIENWVFNGGYLFIKISDNYFFNNRYAPEGFTVPIGFANTILEKKFTRNVTLTPTGINTIGSTSKS